MSEKVKVAVIGVGYLGKFHAKIYSEHPDVELVGVVDARMDNAQEIANQYSTTPYTSYQDKEEEKNLGGGVEGRN